MSYFLFSPNGVFKEISMTYIVYFLLQRFSHMSLQWGNNHYMLYHFLLIFPLGLKEFLTAYLSSISPHFYPIGLFGGLILLIDLKMDSIKGGVLQRRRSCSHLRMLPWREPLPLPSPLSSEPSALWAVACMHLPMASVQVYKYTSQINERTLWFICNTQCSIYIPVSTHYHHLTLAICALERESRRRPARRRWKHLGP